MSDSTADKQDPTLDHFPFQTFDKVRYADTDRQGHVNNAAFATFLETGRVEFLYDPRNPLAADNASFVIANLNIALKAEITWPGQVDIGTGVTRIGNSSLQLYQGLFQDGRLVATAETVVVQVNNESKRPQALSDETKAFLKQYQQM